MRTEQLGNTDLALTVIGLGTWAMGGTGWEFGWGEQSDRESEKTITRALELGINWIDTAPIYGLGHAEEVVGRTIRAFEERPVIATKCGLLWDSEGRITYKHTAETVRKELEDSLRRLQVDVIDLYQIHWAEPDAEIEAAWETMATLVQEGKIRHAGVSNFNLSQLRRAQAIHPVASLQPPYSMLERQVEVELLTYCKRNGIGVLAYSPMQKGILTDKFTRDFIKKLPLDDHRTGRDVNFKEPRLSANLELVDLLRGIARKRNCSVAQLAVAWVLRRDEVTSAIVGARKPAHVEDSIRGWQCKLIDSDLSVIQMFLAQRGL